MVYQYIAYSETGKVVTGRLSVASEEAAAEMLGYAGYQVISLKPIDRFLSLDGLRARLFPVKPAEVILFYRQLALLLESGISITTALELLREQASNRTLEGVLGEVISDLRSGNQLSAAMGKHPEVFLPIYCRLVGVGEQTGELETMLRLIADYKEKEVAAAKGVKSALRYPIIVAIVAVVVIGILVTFVLPAFGDLYSSMGAELPAMTKMLIAMAEKFQQYGLYLILGLGAAAGMAFAYFKTPEGRYKWDKICLSLPLVGRVNHLKELVLCCRSLALLFRAGLPLTEIMPLVTQSSRNRVMIGALDDLQQDMLKGEGLSRPMAKNQLFLPMMVQMVKVGEETGSLDATLLAVAQSYETEAEERTRNLIGLIQPTMMIVISGVVGFVAISMVSAMYSIYGQAL
jgi:type IV pilus assembly protein PilC